ncbi:GatB/YqeY domain-containing protein [Candidatus Falkowbacteria bacterium]|nr:GatB/YqeY domain-containing protein [Candidatus Falkowbacteria bacterium]
MSLIQHIDVDLKAAMLAKNEIDIGTLRMLKTSLKNRAVEMLKPLEQLSDEEVVAVLKTESKKRKESIEIFGQNNRADLADKEKAELNVIEKYLPRQISAEELKAKITEAIAEMPENDRKNFGAIMKVVMAKYPGQIDGKIASSIIKEACSL